MTGSAFMGNWEARNRSSALASSGGKSQDAIASRVLKQLILTADDFGRSPEINAAIERAHRAGFLTQASLMVNEAAVDDAVVIAHRNPGLQVGLHLTLCDGRASQVSPLSDRSGNLPATPAGAGMRYFFSPRMAAALPGEIARQFERFASLGLAPTYWDGHTHLHLHPTILRFTVPIAAAAGFRGIRLVREPGPLAVLPWIFGQLSRSAIPLLNRHAVGFADHVFGLRDTGRMTTGTLTRQITQLPAGMCEIYFHPGAEKEEIDYAALAASLQERQIELVDWRAFRCLGN